MHKQNKDLIQALSDYSAEGNHYSSACLQEDDIKMMSNIVSATTHHRYNAINDYD